MVSRLACAALNALPSAASFPINIASLEARDSASDTKTVSKPIIRIEITVADPRSPLDLGDCKWLSLINLVLMMFISFFSVAECVTLRHNRDCAY